MARIRTIKPEFFTSLTVADLPLSARLTFIGLWTHVDDEGRCVDDPRLVRAAVWPLDDRTAAEVEDDLRALHDASLIRRYEAAGRRFLAVSNWSEHQRIDKPKPSKIPAPEDGTPVPPSPRGADSAPVPSSANVESPDASQTDPRHIRDASRNGRGRIPVGTGNREQGTGKGTGRETAGARDDETPTPAAPSVPALSHTIPADWTPNENDLDAAREYLDRLGAEPAADATRKFVRHHQAKATTAADFGPLWVTWISNERTPASATSVVVPFRSANGAQGSTADQRTAAALDLSARLAAEEQGS